MEMAIARWREEEDDFRDDLSVVVLKLPITTGEQQFAKPKPIVMLATRRKATASGRANSTQRQRSKN
jgi:hypothetical protein